MRSKQVLGIQFYRQKPIGEHIVDFFAPRAKLVVEVDGSQHMGADYAQKDRRRDRYLASLGLKVLRFTSREVLKESNAVIEAIYRALIGQLITEIPPAPPLKKGENMGKTSKLAPMDKGGQGGFLEGAAVGKKLSIGFGYAALREVVYERDMRKTAGG